MDKGNAQKFYPKNVERFSPLAHLIRGCNEDCCETRVEMIDSPDGGFVLVSDFDACNAEREAMEKFLRQARPIFGDVEGKATKAWCNAVDKLLGDQS